MNEFIKSLYNTALEADMPIVNLDNAARIMAVSLVHGNNEELVYCPKYIAESEYIQKKFGIYGTGTPDPEFAKLLKCYVKELSEFERSTNYEDQCKWAKELFLERYGIVLK